jgi:predicted nucleotidyltransferase
MDMQQDFPTIPPWLDSETTALVKETIDLLAERHPDLLAVILYGSVARHDERPADEPSTSDVDLLAVFDTDNPRVVRSQRGELIHTIGLAEMHHLDAPREVSVLFSSRTSQEWDQTFITNVRRDGVVLYQRGALPAPFAA